LVVTSAIAQVVPGTLDVHWNEGAKDCTATPQPPLQVHEYESQTFILRQSPCADFEANFLYLLIGSNEAMLIDTGAVAEPKRMPLATTVLQLLPNVSGARLPLLVVHTHKHLDHRAADGQFQNLPGVQLVPADLDSVRSFFGFSQWPEGIAHVDLGGRIVDVLPAPGHQFCHVVFYDNRTAAVFSGDFLIPGRLLVDDATAYQQSAVRLIGFLENRPVSHILGGHIELNTHGDTYWFGTTYHPNERALALSKEDLLALPAAFDHFNGFYNSYPDFVLYHSIRILIVEAIGALALLTAAVWGLIRLWKRLRRRAQQHTPAP
jgi:glyoxylase-like metal-dependent hydrolase (beta-lactamase superfamily II)